VRPTDFYNFDIIIAMDDANLRDLRRMAPTPEAEDKVVPMAKYITLATRYDYIPDPYYEGAEGFELVLDLLQDACNTLYNSLIKQHNFR
jgi:protein-tyrosine phosphatase